MFAEGTGAGVKVGILDTGVDSSHPALDGCVSASYDVVTRGSKAVVNSYRQFTGDFTRDPDFKFPTEEIKSLVKEGIGTRQWPAERGTTVTLYDTVLIDEAQNMEPRTLEELRMLTNVNAQKDYLLQEEE